MVNGLIKDSYDYYMEEALADPNHREADGGIYYYTYGYDEDHGAFLRQIDDNTWVMISSDGGHKIEDITARITLTKE